MAWIRACGGGSPAVPRGQTVTPTDDITIWQECAGIVNPTYTTLGQVLADSGVLSALISSNNAVDYMVRSTTWVATVCSNSSAMIKIGANNYCADKLLSEAAWSNGICLSTYFESVLNAKVPAMTGDTTPSGEVLYNDQVAPYLAYKAFNGVASDTEGWACIGGNGAYIGYEFTVPVNVYRVKIWNRNEPNPRAIKQFKVQQSSDNVTWDDITATLTNTNSNAGAMQDILTTSTTKHNSCRVLCLSDSYQAPYIGVGEVQFYGRKDV